MPEPIENLWPPFGLRITCGPVTLTPVRDGELALSQKLVLTAETLNRPSHELTVDGASPLQKFLGLTP